MSFDSLGLPAELLSAIADQGYETPSPVQQKAIPAIQAGRDVMAAAQTGTGKTAGFVLPILQRLAAGARAEVGKPTALVLTPTRELAAQIGDNASAYGKNVPVTHAVVFGGVNIKGQIKTLGESTDILIATPGRLLDLHGQGVVSFDDLQVLVLDEADRMLDMGFIHDIQRVLELLPQTRQNLMFSATFSDEIRELARGLVKDPVEISVNPPNSTVGSVEQQVLTVNKSHKWRVLVHLINEQQWPQVLVFSRTKHGANRLVRHLEKAEISALAIHGNKSQSARTRALSEFKAGEIRVLVATDIAARGLDIDQLPQVVNYDLPNVPEDYVHRIGRTGRAGADGRAVSLVCGEEGKLLVDIERFIGVKIDRGKVPGFEFTEEWVMDTAPKGNRDNNRQQQGDPRSARRRDGDQAAHPDGDEAQSVERNKPARKRNRNSRQKKKSLARHEDRQPLDNANLPPTLEHSVNRSTPQRPPRNGNSGQRRRNEAHYQMGEDDLPEINGNRIDGPEVHEGTLWMQQPDSAYGSYQQNNNRARRANGNGQADGNRQRKRNHAGSANGNRNRKKARGGGQQSGGQMQNRQSQGGGNDGGGQQQRRRRRRHQTAQ